MARRTLSLSFGIALLTCVGLWVLSYASIYYRGHAFLVTAYAGHFQFLHTDEPWVERTNPEKHPMGWKVRGYHGLGVLWWPSYTFAPTYWTVHIPLWMPTLLFAISFPYVYFPLRRHRQRLQHGLCLACGYDLRATRGRCPECGMPVASK